MGANRALLLIAAAVSVIGCRGGGGAARPARSDAAAAHAVDTAFAVALNGANADAVAETYDENAWLMPPGAPPVKGRDGIRGFWSGLLESYDVHLTFGVDRFDGRGDLAYIVGHYHMELRQKSPEVPVQGPEDGKFLEVLRRGPDGRWRYEVDMFSANTPPK